MCVSYCRCTERQLLQILLEHLVTAIRTALADARKQDPNASPPSPITLQCVREMCSEARTLLAGYMCWQNLECTLTSIVSSLAEYDLKVSAGKWEELELLAVLGSARVYVGLAQVYLMCPSPVDPIVTARTKYRCLEHLVRNWEGEGGGARGYRGEKDREWDEVKVERGEWQGRE